MTLMYLSKALWGILALPTLSAAYTWNFKSLPQQCSNLTISISGSGGKPPYRVLVVPFGPTPLDKVEARRIIDQPFPDNSNTVSFKLSYPADSQFVAVVSDSSGFGTGGTSVAAQVTDSSDSSCFDKTKSVEPLFGLILDPPNQIVQCQNTRLSWTRGTVQGTPKFFGVIPGGQSFAVPQSDITDQSNDGKGIGFTWKPSIKGGTTLLLIAGDDRGNGTGGSFFQTVSNGPENDDSCLSNTSPSSTPGSPAGGTYPTSSTGAGVGGGGGGGGGDDDGGSKTNVGAIVGGVVGGVAFLTAIILVLFFMRRRSKHSRRQKERPVDLLNADEGDESPTSGPGGRTSTRNELPEYYQPEPFMVPDPTIRSSYDGTGATSSEGRPLSGYTSTSRSGTPDLLGSVYGGTGTSGAGSSAGGRKGAFRPMRPVNVIQHDDAGPQEPAGGAEEEVETVELPPAYTNIRK
ncbi:hypothetical protein BDZ94DRAFT_1210476 [Collybia nuda]|uniref:Uncharacterized protein n=1 Tax=Collybia nuda TaxID=64659 RepID=A0A9P5YDF1_9AGAR|nr:hypothetical protein BDZ94DRAFT_1210476 [Collybia nuda]